MPEFFEIDFTPQYNQFYLSSDKGDTALADGLEWSEESYNDRLAVYEKFIVVYPESYGYVKGELYLLESLNSNIDFLNYDHIVEGGLSIESGILQILNCPNSSIEFQCEILPGSYRIRIYFSSMAGYDSDEDESDDRCRIEVWPATNFQVKVLKRLVRSS